MITSTGVRIPLHGDRRPGPPGRSAIAKRGRGSWHKSYADYLRRLPSGSRFGWSTVLPTPVDQEHVQILRLVASKSPTVFATLPVATEVAPDGKQTKAQWIHGLASGPDNCLYYSERHAIRRFSPDGVVSLVAVILRGKRWADRQSEKWEEFPTRPSCTSRRRLEEFWDFGDGISRRCRRGQDRPRELCQQGGFPVCATVR